MQTLHAIMLVLGIAYQGGLRSHLTKLKALGLLAPRFSQ
jgi:hypothetical protein